VWALERAAKLPDWVLRSPSLTELKLAATGSGLFPFVNRERATKDAPFLSYLERVRQLTDAVRKGDDVSPYGVRDLLFGAPREQVLAPKHEAQVAFWTREGLRTERVWHDPQSWPYPWRPGTGARLALSRSAVEPDVPANGPGPHLEVTLRPLAEGRFAWRSESLVRSPYRGGEGITVRVRPEPGAPPGSSGRLFASWGPQHDFDPSAPLSELHLATPETPGLHVLRFSIDPRPERLQTFSDRAQLQRDILLSVGPHSLNPEWRYAARFDLGPNEYAGYLLAVERATIAGGTEQPLTRSVLKPGEAVDAEIVWQWPLRENTGAIFTGAVVASWLREPVVTIPRLSPVIGASRTTRVSFPAPSEPGVYALRLVLNAGFEPPRDFDDRLHYSMDFVFVVKR
jgi:hypothetical protein